MSLKYNIYFGISAIVFMVILVIYSKISYSMESRRNREFYKLTIYVLIADILDVVTAITISYGNVIPIFFNLLLNTCYFGGNAVLCYQFLKYSTFCAKSFEGEPKVEPAYKIVMYLQGVFLFVNMFTGWMFYFDEAGNYVHGPAYFLTFTIPYACFFLGVIRMVRNVKDYDMQQKLSIFSFAIIALMGAVIQIGFLPHVLLTMFALSVGLIIVLFSLETPEYQKLVQTLEELKVAKQEAEEAKKKAEIANQAKSNFLANVSHEIRTPIHAVLGMNEMILRESDEEEILEYSRNIQSATGGLLALINDILDISKIESGKMELVLGEYSLFHLLKDCYNMIDVQIKQKGLRLLVENETQIPNRLIGDEIRIRQIFFNLLTNAYKYTPEGTITIRIKHKRINSGEILLLFSVEDTGIGIAEEDQAKLFEFFERVDKQRNHNIEGTGLGLAITKELVDLMNGEIGIISTLGKGSLFYVGIPQQIVGEELLGNFYERYNEAMERIIYKEKWQAPKARILIVDDIEMNLTVAKNLLKNTKIQIDTATSGARCLDMTMEQKYHVILLDHMMPEMDGLETLQRLRAQKGKNVDTPVIVSTANAVSGALKEYEEAGFSDYLVKPTTGKEMEQVIVKYLPKEIVEELP